MGKRRAECMAGDGQRDIPVAPFSVDAWEGRTAGFPHHILRDATMASHAYLAYHTYLSQETALAGCMGRHRRLLRVVGFCMYGGLGG